MVEREEGADPVPAFDDKLSVQVSVAELHELDGEGLEDRRYNKETRRRAEGAEGEEVEEVSRGRGEARGREG